MSSQLQVSGEAKIRDIQGPVVANSGVITALDGAANQYVRGDGTLAIFPSSSGGGSSVSYYLNGSVNQGTFGGSTYYQMSRNAIVGTGTNFSTSTDGLLAQFITDANDPDVVSIPSGNWNVEFFMNVSASSGALASFYVEIYKYNGSTFTLLATNVATPEQLTNTTTVDAYFTSVAMPLSAMAVTDRLAVRIFANVASKTVTLYTEDNRLCQIVTTFSNGLTSLNNLTDQSQYLTTGTSGTDFNIVSSGDTHTFNIPSASATNRGLVTIGSQSFEGIKTFNDAIKGEEGVLLKNGVISSSNGYTALNAFENTLIITSLISGTPYSNSLEFTPSTSNTYTFPNASGTIALTSNLSSYVPYTGATASVNLGTYGLKAGSITTEGGYNFKILASGTLFENGYSVLSSVAGNVSITQAISAGNLKTFTFDFSAWATNTSRTYTLPDITGTLALLEGTQTFSGQKTFSLDILVNGLTVGRGAGSVSTNTVLGTTALSSNTTGASNVAIGINSLNTNTTGGSNVAVGQSSLQTNNGNQNTAIGNQALQFNTTGSQNTALGHISLQNNTTGSTNTAIGSFSLQTNTTGYGNTSVGYSALGYNTTGFFNAAIGVNALLSNTTGTYNNALGTASLYNNTTGSNNTAVGQQAGTNNTTGSNNTYIGFGSGGGITTGSNNTIIGQFTGTAAMANNIVLADGAGNVRYRYDGTNNNLYGNVNFSSTIGNGTYTYTLPSATGTLALTSDLSSYVPYTGATTNVSLGSANSLSAKEVSVYNGSGYNTIIGQTNGIAINFSTFSNRLYFESANNTFTFPNATGIVALTSNLSAYLPLTGGTLTGALSGTSASFSSTLAAMGSNIQFNLDGTFGTNYYTLGFGGVSNGFNRIAAGTGTTDGLYILAATGRDIVFRTNGSGSNTLVLASTGAATFSNNLAVGGSTDDTSGGLYSNIALNGSTYSRYSLLTGGTARARFQFDGTNTTLTTTSTGGKLQLATFGAAAMEFVTNDTLRMTITSGGNVGIGTSSPQGNLEVVGLTYFTRSSQSTLINPNYGSAGTHSQIQVVGNMALAFATNGDNERMRITSGGNVGIGTSSPSYKLDIRNDVGASTSLDPISIGLYNGNDGGSAIYFRNSVGGQSKISFGVEASGSGTDDTYLGFSTGGNTSLSERMRITSGGNVLIGTTSDTGDKFQVAGAVASRGSNSIFYFDNRTSSNKFGWYGSTSVYLYNTDVGDIATIAYNTGAYTALSDINKKKDFEDSKIGLNAILGLKPTLYRMKDEDNTEKHLGFIAQEVKEFIPQAYVEQGEFIGLQDRPIIAALVKAIQEQQAQIELLSNKIVALESK